MRQVGGLGRVLVSGAPPGALAWLSVALAGQGTLGGAPLPLQLDPYGMPGCLLRVPPVVAVPTAIGTQGLDRGYAAVDLPVGLVPAGGLPLAAQWLVLDPVGLGYGLTPRHEFRVQ